MSKYLFSFENNKILHGHAQSLYLRNVIEGFMENQFFNVNDKLRYKFFHIIIYNSNNLKIM